MLNKELLLCQCGVNGGTLTIKTDYYYESFVRFKDGSEHSVPHDGNTYTFPCQVIDKIYVSSNMRVNKNELVNVKYVTHDSMYMICAITDYSKDAYIKIISPN